MDKSLELIAQFNDLGLSKNFDFDKFNHFAIVHHSSTIEGSTLTEVETQLLLDENLTPKGKPLDHSLMVSDHYNALNFVLEPANLSRKLSVQFIQEINAQVLKRTGQIASTILGTVDASKGELRKSNVSVGNSYPVNYDKVEKLLTRLCDQLNENLARPGTTLERLDLSFDAHFDLVTLHPFYDGNGRTSRLLMNYLQQRSNLPLGLVFLEDKVDYFEALIATRQKEDLQIFRNFMHMQYQKLLVQEINKFKEIQKPLRGRGFSMIF
jgi:Fic family protein